MPLLTINGYRMDGVPIISGSFVKRSVRSLSDLNNLNYILLLYSYIIHRKTQFVKYFFSLPELSLFSILPLLILYNEAR